MDFRPFAVIALLGIVLTAGYYLIALQKIYLGKTPEVYQDPEAYPDVTKREMLVLVPLAVVTLWMGIQPGIFMDLYAGVTNGLAETLQAAATTVTDTTVGGAG